jgi:5,6-dimethylbenzimidazole synthase
MNHAYSDAERAAVYRAIYERRDMRHFLPDALAPTLLARLLQAAHAAPSVGLMQPWRFMHITDNDLRIGMHALVEQERRLTAKALGEREDEFMRLKVEGMLECPVLLVAALCEQREAHIFGRRTLPEMDVASLSCAIQNLWLAARGEGVGVGWVSLFEPEALKTLLNMPADTAPLAILCVGYVAEFYEQPLLELQGWAKRRDLNTLVFENTWNTPCRSI